MEHGPKITVHPQCDQPIFPSLKRGWVVGGRVQSHSPRSPHSPLSCAMMLCVQFSIAMAVRSVIWKWYPKRVGGQREEGAVDDPSGSLAKVKGGEGEVRGGSECGGGSSLNRKLEVCGKTRRDVTFPLRQNVKMQPNGSPTQRHECKQRENATATAAVATTTMPTNATCNNNNNNASTATPNKGQDHINEVEIDENWSNWFISSLKLRFQK